MDMRKRCGKCFETKLACDFHKQTAARDGLQNYCKPCQQVVNTSRDVFVMREQQRQRSYGVTPARYRALERAQFRSCVACKVPFGLLEPWDVHVDHDHATGAVRGLLCRDCNKGLGLFHDKPAALMAAARYLRASA